jgi:hypothetical protein
MEGACVVARTDSAGPQRAPSRAVAEPLFERGLSMLAFLSPPDIDLPSTDVGSPKVVCLHGRLAVVECRLRYETSGIKCMDGYLK